MKVCLDARVSTRGGTSTFIDNFLAHLTTTPHQHAIHIIGGDPYESCLPVPQSNRMVEFTWSQTVLPVRLRQQKFDIYHSLKHIGPLACPARTVYRVPAVGQFNGTYPLKTMDSIYWGRVGKRAYRNADLLIAVSDFVRTGLLDCLSLPEQRVVTVHNGVDPVFRPLNGSTKRPESIGRPFLLCVGNLLPVKNFATAIRAYKQLRQETKCDPALVVVGATRGNHFGELKQLATSLRIENDVLFLGYQSRDAMVQLYNSAEMLVHPSLHEGFSLTILEAMACGLPIVASNTTSIPEAAGDAALYHDPLDVAHAADSMRQLLDSSQLRRQLSTTAISRAENYSWQSCVAKTLAAYERIN